MGIVYHRDEDQRLAKLLESETLLAPSLDPAKLAAWPGAETRVVSRPTDQYRFLHEAAIIAFHGTLFAAWYNCPESELMGVTPIRGCHSSDGGRTWSNPVIIAEDRSGRLLYCPPVFGIEGDTLYLIMNSMVSADHIHSTDFYRYDENAGRFQFLRSIPLPFKLNTNVYRLPNGKRMLPGRMAKLDQFPQTPGILLSDSGKIDGDWRAVLCQKDGGLPDGSSLIHPECSAVVLGERIVLFCRDDERNVPLLYRSEDSGEHWRGPIAHDIPFSNSKIYSGTLADGRNYVIGNLRLDEVKAYDPSTRSKLAIFFSEPGTMEFTRGGLLRDGYDPALNLYPQWSYPVATELDGRLYVIHTMETCPEDNVRGAVVTVVPLKF